MFSHYLSIALRNLRLAPFAALAGIFTLALVTFVATCASHFANIERTQVITSRQAPA